MLSLRSKAWQIRLELEPQDCWIGCYWTWRASALHLYVCLVPCLPVHIIWQGPVAPQEEDTV